MIRYIKNIDISFSISIYCIVSYRRKKISNFSIYRDILRQKFIFLLLHYENNENKQRKRQSLAN